MRALSRRLLAGDGEDSRAWRDGQRFVLRLAAAGTGAAGAVHAWRADAAYLVTGGLGGVGLHIARAMVRGGARRLVLLGPHAAAAARALGRRRRAAVPPAAHRRGARARSRRRRRAPRGGRRRRRGAARAPSSTLRRPRAGRRSAASIHAAGRARATSLTARMDRAAFDAVLAAQAAAGRSCSTGCCRTSISSSCSRPSAPSSRSPAWPTTRPPTPASTRWRRTAGRAACRRSASWGAVARHRPGARMQRRRSQCRRDGPPGRRHASRPSTAPTLFDWLLRAGADTHRRVLPVDWRRSRRARAGRDDAALPRAARRAATAAPAATRARRAGWPRPAPAERRAAARRDRARQPSARC